MVAHRITDAFKSLFPELYSRVIRYKMPVNGKSCVFTLKEGPVLTFIYRGRDDWTLETSK